MDAGTNKIEGQAHFGKHSRRYCIRLGNFFRVVPLNPQKLKHRDRLCWAVSLDGDDVGVRFLDNHRRGFVDPGDLLPLEASAEVPIPTIYYEDMARSLVTGPDADHPAVRTLIKKWAETVGKEPDPDAPDYLSEAMLRARRLVRADAVARGQVELQMLESRMWNSIPARVVDELKGANALDRETLERGIRAAVDSAFGEFEEGFKRISKRVGLDIEIPAQPPPAPKLRLTHPD